MKHLILGFFLTLTSFSLFAAETNCGGTVTLVMADYGCQGNMAFKTTQSGSKWMCTKSKEAGSVLLAAFMAGKTVSAYIEISDVGQCANLPNYRNINYLIIQP
ncbi:MAG: hypothetical protein ACRBCS_02215 [Cellvibrionaceae bacterium]